MDIVRKLATIRKVADIVPIENADNIISVKIDGWNVVTQKSNNFKIDDLVVYFEIDSFLPVTEKFEFLRASSFKLMGYKEGFRLRTIRLKKTISQGLIMPLSEFPELGDVAEGDNLTEILGIEKWEPPIHPSLSGISKGNFPSFIPKTDQERIQNIYGSRRKWTGNNDTQYEVSIKLDGTSMTVYYYNNVIGVCSRNLELIDTPDNIYWKVARETGLIDAIKEMCHQEYMSGIAIQGELMGEGIQGNRENIKGHKFFIFDMYNINTGRYLNAQERLYFLSLLRGYSYKLEICHVPVIEFTTLDKFTSVNSFIEYAKRGSLTHPIAEGVVFKSIPDDSGPIHSFKVINNEFLLKEK